MRTISVLIVALVITSSVDAGVILSRMTGTNLRWQGVQPATEPAGPWAYEADVYLLDDLSGGLVWLESDYRSDAWVVALSPVATPGNLYLHGDGVSLDLYGDFSYGADFKSITSASVTWWPDEFNPSNYVSGLRAEGVLYQTVKGVYVPEPRGEAVCLVLFVLMFFSLMAMGFQKK